MKYRVLVVSMVIVCAVAPSLARASQGCECDYQKYIAQREKEESKPGDDSVGTAVVVLGLTSSGAGQPEVGGALTSGVAGGFSTSQYMDDQKLVSLKKALKVINQSEMADLDDFHSIDLREFARDVRKQKGLEETPLELIAATVRNANEAFALCDKDRGLLNYGDLVKFVANYLNDKR